MRARGESVKGPGERTCPGHGCSAPTPRVRWSAWYCRRWWSRYSADWEVVLVAAVTLEPWSWAATPADPEQLRTKTTGGEAHGFSPRRFSTHQHMSDRHAPPAIRQNRHNVLFCSLFTHTPSIFQLALRYDLFGASDVIVKRYHT